MVNTRVERHERECCGPRAAFPLQRPRGSSAPRQRPAAETHPQPHRRKSAIRHQRLHRPQRFPWRHSCDAAERRRSRSAAGISARARAPAPALVCAPCVNVDVPLPTAMRSAKARQPPAFALAYFCASRRFGQGRSVRCAISVCVCLRARKRARAYPPLAALVATGPGYPPTCAQ